MYRCHTAAYFLCWQGFGDAQGAEINIANAVNIKSILHAARSVKIAVLVDGRSLSTARARDVKSLVQAIMKITGGSAKVTCGDYALSDTVSGRLSKSTTVPFCLGSLKKGLAMRMGI